VLRAKSLTLPLSFPATCSKFIEIPAIDDALFDDKKLLIHSIIFEIEPLFVDAYYHKGECFKAAGRAT
jgi:hypothetical protein